MGQEGSHWPRINRNQSYLISRLTKALARNWLLGYLFVNRNADPGSVRVCSPVALQNYPPPRLHACIRFSLTANHWRCFNLLCVCLLLEMCAYLLPLDFSFICSLTLNTAAFVVCAWAREEVVTTRKMGGGMCAWAIVIGPTQTLMIWGHIHLSWPSGPTPLFTSCRPERVAASPPGKTSLPPVLSAPCPRQNEAATCRIRFHSGDTALSSTNDGGAWIFTGLDINILAWQCCTSPVPTPIRLYGSVTRWSRLYLAKLSPPPFISHLVYWKNKLLPAREWVKMIKSGSSFWVLLMAVRPLCIQSSFLFHR